MVGITKPLQDGEIRLRLTGWRRWLVISIFAYTTFYIASHIEGDPSHLITLSLTVLVVLTLILKDQAYWEISEKYRKKRIEIAKKDHHK